MEKVQRRGILVNWKKYMELVQGYSYNFPKPNTQTKKKKKKKEEEEELSFSCVLTRSIDPADSGTL